MKPKNIIIVVTIIVVGLLLGVAAGNLFTAPKEEGNAEPAPPPDEEPAIELPQIGLPKSFPQPPAPDATDEEKADFVLVIFNLAKDADTIDIHKNCDFSPAIVRIPEGNSVKFSNKDSVPHAIRIFEELVIPAGEENSLVAKFESGPGVYGIQCDGTQEDITPEGYLHILGETEI